MNNSILLFGDKTVYESHFLGQQALPFVFHRHNRFTAGQGCIANLHKNIEILYITAGSGNLICGGQVLAVARGDLAVVNSYQIHKTVADRELDYACLILGDDFAQAHGLPMDRLQLAPLIQDRNAAALFESLLAEYDLEKAFQTSGIQCTVLQFLLYLCRGYSSPRQQDAVNDTALESVWAATAYMKRNMRKKLTVEEVAAHAGFSKYYFLRLFKKITGCTVTQYWNLLRCEYAGELLRGGGVTVRQAAERSGFENFSYFTSVFKKCMGCLPGELVKRNENARGS